MAKRVDWLGTTLAISCVAAGAAVVPGCFWVHATEPTRDVYEPCEADSQCPVGEACWSVTISYGYEDVTDSLCTSRCSSDWDCAYDGACQDPDAGPPLCYARCFDDHDCYAGFACDIDALDPICIPW